MKWLLRTGLIAALVFVSCTGPAAAPSPASPSPDESPTLTLAASAAATERPTATATPRPTATPTLRVPTPTPDPPRARDPNLEALGDGWTAFAYKVQAGDDLGRIAAQYGLSYDQIRTANGFNGGEVLLPGQIVLVPQFVQHYSPTFKLIAEGELVYGPSTVGFDTAKFVARYRRGYLYHYAETVNGQAVSGAALIQRAAESFSVNPRLLLALLEYQSAWLTQDAPDANAVLYPFGRAEGGTEGLYRQLQWAANTLNRAFYQWRDGSLSLLILGDGTRVGLSEGLNAGTAAVQYFFSLTRSAGTWESTVNRQGFFKTYTTLFGDPFANVADSPMPKSLTQPELTLPWQGGETWFYSGGPHPSFGAGSPWGAVDFLPPGREAGCETSPNWITAVASGHVVRSRDGQVLLDLDLDGNEQTGWVILYLHVAEQDRVAQGTFVNRGDHIGHASCEGGFAEDAHVHLARKYNGVWLPADDPLAPFVLGGYTLRSTGSEYNGLIEGFGAARLACACRQSSNAITK